MKLSSDGISLCESVLETQIHPDWAETESFYNSAASYLYSRASLDPLKKLPVCGGTVEIKAVLERRISIGLNMTKILSEAMWAHQSLVTSQVPTSLNPSV